MKNIKLTPKQKEVIMAMREKEGVYWWRGMPMCKFTFRGKTFRYDTGASLLDKKLIERSGTSYIDYPYTLTELGKTIPL